MPRKQLENAEQSPEWSTKMIRDEELDHILESLLERIQILEHTLSSITNVNPNIKVKPN